MARKAKGKYSQGKYVPRNPIKYQGNPNDIWYRSSWEWRMMDWLDKNPQVLKWSSETTVIPYRSPLDENRKIRRYFVDFKATIKNNRGEESTYLIEIKPKIQTQPPVMKTRTTKRYLTEAQTFCTNKAKWEAATTYANQRGYKFVVLTEEDLGIGR